MISISRKEEGSKQILTQLKISVSQELATVFKTACNNAKVSMAGAISEFMSKYSKHTLGNSIKNSYKTKRQRRNAVKNILKELEAIREMQEVCKENIPENLQNSENYEIADEWIEALEECIEVLSSLP